MTVIYSVSMNKGGVAKTTLATNLAAVIAKENPQSRVLLVDMDGQGNSAISFGLVPSEFKTTMHDVLTGQATIEQAVIQLEDNLYIAPSNDDMNFFEIDVLTNLSTYPEPQLLLREPIRQASSAFDFIAIDTPPALGLVAANVLSIEDNRVLIPFCPEVFGIQGLLRVIKEVRNFKASKNPTLEIAGVVGQMIDSRTNLHTTLLQQARRECFEMGVPFLDTVVPKSIRFANATAYYEKPAVLVDRSEVSQSYYEIGKELATIGAAKA